MSIKSKQRSKTLGIILAGGLSSRLYPATLVTSKQVLPVYDKPMIYYPLSTMMLAGIRDYYIIVNPHERVIFESLFADSKRLLGINITFLVQEKPNGIPEAFNLVTSCLDFDESKYDRYGLILGDNLFYGAALSDMLQKAAKKSNKATIFAAKVHDPERFGVVEIDKKGKAVSIEEKPKAPKSQYAVTGLYFYPSDVLDVAYALIPSARGETEITDLNNAYMGAGRLTVNKLLRGMVWFDTGTPDALLESANFIQTIQDHQDILIGAPHEVAFLNGWIDQTALMESANLCGKSFYGKYLRNIVEDSNNG